MEICDILRYISLKRIMYAVKETPFECPKSRESAFDAQAPKWPIECQVLEERVRHISDSPPTNEIYYVRTVGSTDSNESSKDYCRKIVYHYTPYNPLNYFGKANMGGSKFLLPSNPCPFDDTLRFESRFESGNLAKAVMVAPNSYELHLRPDFYTSKHRQWFYFRISNVKKEILYKFSILNCSKEGSLYNEGLRPIMYSTKESKLNNVGWRRCGTNISYFCNNNVAILDTDPPKTFTLTFTIRFPHSNDEVYLAHCYPYTYSDLQDYLLEMSTSLFKSQFTTIVPLCKTLAGNNVYYITITSPHQKEKSIRKKKAIVLTARVHPGETPSSWIMKGILDYLSSNCAPAKELRNKFIFQIIPMLNPDGVIIGNSRCSLSGKDLNRQYRAMLKDDCPCIWYTKLLIAKLVKDYGVAMYCDIHSHSRKHNCFVYGCGNRSGNDKRPLEQVFPLMLHKKAPDKFSFDNCLFKISKMKKDTGRVVMWMMGITNSYTLETSIAGSTIGHRAYTHFTIQDYEKIGKTFCQTLFDFYDEDKVRLRTKLVEGIKRPLTRALDRDSYGSCSSDTESFREKTPKKKTVRSKVKKKLSEPHLKRVKETKIVKKKNAKKGWKQETQDKDIQWMVKTAPT